MKPIVIITLIVIMIVIMTVALQHKPEMPKEEMSMEKKNELSHYVTKEGGTEPAFQNEYWDEKRPGIYVDINTGEALFSSLDKFDSGSGWPSFTKPIDGSTIQEEQDLRHGMNRVEVKTEESHLGHVFDDGPNGQDRYCINSAALKFIPYEKLEEQGYGEYKTLFSFEKATFAGGCFWGVEHLFSQVEGVVSATSGYMGGDLDNPSYKEVSKGDSGHAEVVQLEFDPDIVSYKELVDYFWRVHDPTQLNRQGWDVGTQYRSAIFYHNEEQKEIAQKSKQLFDEKEVFDTPAVTEIVPASAFFAAEDYHQNYYEKNTSRSCHALRDE